MKINWFSPVPPTPSAIAFHNAAVLPALTRQADVTLWVHEATWSPTLEEHASVRHYDPEKIPWADINAADVTIYHLGNQPEFHGPIWRVNRQHPGIVALHDLNLQHLFAGLVIGKLGLSHDEYRRMMEFHHPDGGSELATAFLYGGRTADEICEHCPLTGAALENATGVAVHTQVGYSLVKSSTTVPVAYVPLCATPNDEIAGDRERTVAKEPGDSRYRIILFGFVGANRRLESVLEALHGFAQRDRFRFDIYGTLRDEKSILQMIENLNLKDLVNLHGFVSTAELNTALSRSDLAVNLRDPTMGEASASQLQIWQHGLPSLVTNIGWYATIPKNTVALVRSYAELEDIRTHLADFLRTPETYREIGRNGRQYVKEHHTVAAYVGSLLDLVELTLKAGPQQAVYLMARRAGEEMRPWFSEAAAGVLLPRVAETIGRMFDATGAGPAR